MLISGSCCLLDRHKGDLHPGRLQLASGETKSENGPLLGTCIRVLRSQLEPSPSALIRSSAGVLNTRQQVEAIRTWCPSVPSGGHCVGHLSYSNLWIIRSTAGVIQPSRNLRVMALRIKCKSVFPETSSPETHACCLASERLFAQPCCCAKYPTKSAPGGEPHGGGGLALAGSAGR